MEAPDKIVTRIVHIDGAGPQAGIVKFSRPRSVFRHTIHPLLRESTDLLRRLRRSVVVLPPPVRWRGDVLRALVFVSRPFLAAL